MVGRRKGRERIEKGSRERIEKRERDERFEEKEGLRDPSLFLEFLDPALRCSHCFIKSSGYDKFLGMTSWSSSIKMWFLQAYRMH